MSDEVGTVGWESKRANRAERECDRLKVDVVRLIKERDEALEALRSVMVGGNHLGLIIGADHPPYTTSHDIARKHYASSDQYEAWCCWKTIMDARSILSKYEAKP